MIGTTLASIFPVYVVHYAHMLNSSRSGRNSFLHLLLARENVYWVDLLNCNSLLMPTWFTISNGWID